MGSSQAGSLGLIPLNELETLRALSNILHWENEVKLTDLQLLYKTLGVASAFNCELPHMKRP